MSDRADVARAALEAALAATSQQTPETATTPHGPGGPDWFTGGAAADTATRAGGGGADGTPAGGAGVDGLWPGTTPEAEPSDRRGRGGGRGRGDRDGADARGGRQDRDGRGGRRREPRPPDPEDDPTTRGDEPDPYDVARQIVLRQLSTAPRSRHQLRTKLRQRGCEDDVAEAVLDRMVEVGLVDDEAYAGMLVRTRQSGKGLARRALRQELRAKGIDDEIAAGALDEVSVDDERERARELVEKRLRSMHGLDATVQTRRLAGMLARKGYSTEISVAVIREAIAGAPEHQRD